MSDWLLRCKGCGCAYVRGEKSNADFCQWCCREIKEDPSGFKTLEQREAEKAVLGRKNGRRK